MFKNYIKNLFIIIIIVILLLVLTYINKNYLRDSINLNSNLYTNELSEKIINNDFNDVGYSFLIDDLNNIDDILVDQLALDLDTKKKTEYFKVAIDIYNHKIDEYSKILKYKLDSENYNLFIIELDEFYKDMNFEVDDFNKKYESSIDIEFNKNKYKYESLQKKCRGIIENYKFVLGN